MTDLDRLLAEAIPDGTFGGTHTPAPPRELTTADRAANLRTLADAIGARHLESVPAQPRTQPNPDRRAA